MAKFEKGQTPWNKGKKYSLKHSGQFKKGVPSHMKGKKGLKSWHNISGLNTKGDAPWNKGEKETRPEVLKRISEAHKGIVPSNKGKPMSKQQRIKISLHHTGEKEFTGFKNMLSSRIRGTGKYLQWRSDVFKRDYFYCQGCGEKGYLEAHHIIPISTLLLEFEITNMDKAVNCKELWDIENGISYCKKCHAEKDFHRRIGSGKSLIEVREEEAERQIKLLQEVFRHRN